MGKPFEVTIDCGGGTVVPFSIPEEHIRNHAGIKVQSAIAHRGPDDDDERTRLHRGAIEMIRGMIERNAELPVRIWNGPDVYIIPDQAVRFARLHDPEAPTGKKARVGFDLSGEKD